MKQNLITDVIQGMLIRDRHREQYAFMKGCLYEKRTYFSNML